jgi:hypothetical protein
MDLTIALEATPKSQRRFMELPEREVVGVKFFFFMSSH